MQQEPIANSENRPSTPGLATTPTPASDNGFLSRDASSSSSRNHSPHSDARGGGHAESRQSVAGLSGQLTPVKGSSHGQKITEYEQALTRTSPLPKQPMGFKVCKRAENEDGHSDGIQLLDLPNEILTRIVTKLRPDARAAASLVCKRLSAIVLTPHAWQLTFAQHFPGHTTRSRKGHDAAGIWGDASDTGVNYQQLAFARLTPAATWRSEFLYRCELFQGLSLGRPGVGNASGPQWFSPEKQKTTGPVIYNPQLSWVVTNLHVLYGKNKPSRAVHGSSDSAKFTFSDPSNGRLEKWGLGDDFRSASAEEIYPHIDLYGLGNGSQAPVLVPNPMDLSAVYGRIGGQGYPGGRSYYRGVIVNNSRVNSRETTFLSSGVDVAEERTDIPDVADLSDGVSSVWIAKSSDVPAATQSMVGMLTGTTSGIVTAYSLAPEGSPNRGSVNGCITARWALSPGVPIIAFKVDDEYDIRRQKQARMWAVALNALGEVFYLTQSPKANLDNAGEKSQMQFSYDAWEAGRSVQWHLLEHTRREANADYEHMQESTYSPSSSPAATGLGLDQLQHEAKEISRYCRLPPSYFRRVCAGWDMQRRLEVDFSSDDGEGAGEIVFVVDCGVPRCGPAQVRRYTRSVSEPKNKSQPGSASPRTVSSIFGGVSAHETPASISKRSDRVDMSHDWAQQDLHLGAFAGTMITSTALEASSPSLLTFQEDPLLEMAGQDSKLTERDMIRTIPGGRARFLVAGTSNGGLLVWNGRDSQGKSGHVPLTRAIHTSSPEVTAVAATALYVIHGGSDGLAQAWDPLCSSMEPIHTINKKNAVKIPRNSSGARIHATREEMNTVRGISLDPDPTLLRGCLICGPYIRSWSFSSQHNLDKRKRRLRNIHGRPVNRRIGTWMNEYIAGEEAEVQREHKETQAERERLRKSFGVGNMSEEEAMMYAQMLSQEASEKELQRDQLVPLPEDDSAESELSRLGRRMLSHGLTEQELERLGVLQEAFVNEPVDPFVEAQGLMTDTSGRSRRSSGDDQASVSTLSIENGQFDFAERTPQRGESSSAPFARETQLSNFDVGAAPQVFGSPTNSGANIPITWKFKQSRNKRTKKIKRQDSSSASSMSEDTVEELSRWAIQGQDTPLESRSAGHTYSPLAGQPPAGSKTPNKDEYALSGLSESEQMALAIKLSAVQEETEHAMDFRGAETAADFPSLGKDLSSDKGKGVFGRVQGVKAPVSADWPSATSGELSEDEQLALALKMSMQDQEPDSHLSSAPAGRRFESGQGGHGSSSQQGW